MKTEKKSREVSKNVASLTLPQQEDINAERTNRWTLCRTLVQNGICAEFECDCISIHFTQIPVIKVEHDANQYLSDTIDIEYNPDPEKKRWTKKEIRHFEDCRDEAIMFDGIFLVRELAGVWFVFFGNGNRMKVWKERVKAVLLSNTEDTK